MSMSKCQSDEPDFTGRLFLPGSKFAVALNFSKDQRLATANLIFQATDPFTLADGRPAQRLHFACAIVR
ncbi:MAG: hypothetical protein JO055_05775 [Alphaproteobacteria bacterium]|nr:hypothetical protein [Alphaproteobacteria bacterium]